MAVGLKLVFWLLDLNPKVDKDAGKVDIWLWGITESGDRVLVVDRNFSAYFYAVLRDDADTQKVADSIKLIYDAAVSSVEVVQRRFFGKPVTALKVTCKDATATSKVAKQLRTVGGIEDCLEDGIRAVMRYLLDNGLTPCSWVEVEAVEEENTEGMRVAHVYSVQALPKPLDRVEAPELRVLGFSLLCYSREGTPKAERNPVLAISTAASNGETRQFIAGQDLNDQPVLEAFISYIQEFDPDIIASYGANSLDWSYLRGRSHKLGLHLNFDRAGLEPHTSVYGHVSTTGIVNLDLADFMDVFPEVKVHTLWNLADHLGVLKTEGAPVEDMLVADMWDDAAQRQGLLRFGLDSARKVQGTTALLLDFAIQLAALTSLPLDHVMTAAVGFRVEWFLIRRAQKIGELIPKRIEQPYIPYAGGLVLSPKHGLHENIAVLDFKSMYPNLMITYNLSPDTYIAPTEPTPQKGEYVAPEVGHRFRKAPTGFYKEALLYLIDVRAAIRQKMHTLNPQTVEYRVLDARQKAIKIITNAAYGYAGWIGAKWYIKPVAEAASAWGRHTIQAAMAMAEKAGIEVVYGDTDSLFVSYDQAKISTLQEAIEQELRLDVEVGEVYKRIFFTEAKKRYAGLRPDGSLEIVGLEVIRGDWAEVAKQVQEKVLEIILNEQSPKNAVAYVHETIRQLRHRNAPLEALVIWKTLTKSPPDYAVRAPHVEAAKMLKDRGWRLSGGDKVGYVVLTGKGRLYSRVKPYVFAHIEDVDVDYYVSNQVLPAAVRILSFFGVSENDLLKEEVPKVRSLMEYF